MKLYFVNIITIVFLSIIGHGKTKTTEYYTTQLNEDYKSNIVNAISQKISSFTLESLWTVSSERKMEVLQNIKNKLTRAAANLGSIGDKYIQIIMEGIQNTASNNTASNRSKQLFLKNSTKIPNEARKDNLHITNRSNIIEGNKQGIKHRLVSEIANKIENLVVGALRNVDSQQEKQKIKENVKKKVIEIAEKDQKIIKNKNETKTYSDIISKGIDIISNNMSRKMNIEFITKFRENGDYQEQYDNVQRDSSKIKYNNLRNKQTEKGHKIKTTDYSNYEPSTFNPTFKNEICDCDCVLETICSNVKSMDKLTCKHDGSILPLVKLCDGIADCLDRSDEKDCVTQAMERVRNASNVISSIELKLPHNCFITNVDNDIISTQNSVLQNVLSAQLNFIQKYANVVNKVYNLPSNKINIFNDVSESIIKQTVNEVAVVINTAATALDGALCSRKVLNEDNMVLTRKDGYNILDDELDELDDLISRRNWSPEMCACDGQFCASNKKCSNECNRICWQRFSLGRWVCQSVDNGASIPLDMICDGKLDCYDETDEIDCTSGVSLSKFEASQIFDTVLKVITSSMASKEYTTVRNKFIELHDTIKKLQKFILKARSDTDAIKVIRDECFSTLVSIYNEMLNTASNVDQGNAVYEFLFSINEKLVGALKRSHIGNEKVISDEGCFCRGSSCAVPNCPKKCERTCSVEPMLTSYLCKRDPSKNKSIAIDTVCDGKADCPYESDEVNCKKNEICRKHHFVLLRKSLGYIDNEYKGTATGEVLQSWITKVTARLRIAERNGRPTPILIKDAVKRIVRDLAVAYGSLDNSRRTNNEHIVKVFHKFSQRVIESLKTCGK